MDIERLKTDQDYWDEVAPEGATHCHSLFSPVTWYRRTPKGWQFWTCFSELWMHTPVLVHLLDSLILRPSHPQWRGPEDGLPPAGTVCEYQSDVRSWQAGDRVEVLAHRSGRVDSVAVVWNLRTKQARGVIAGVLRPLKSDKERAVEAAVAATILKGGPRIRAALSDIYDAGLLRLPEEAQ